ncbi:hypothetical protein NEOLI_003266 [Neolecta irregularis DAH-3]|uniref:Uncharacterized protein n=1 Tax=Neolecta irregularis (strain DAH-3) TaxID=1198029 RepID=A0A1U7LPA9_NEOID|nr:hypothetical protein NEOLI_003266 [Neolecta irregularis DAH-3]|eukprot:OLL24487.1 hypothetical protein NEOLI_003266 [Neolecta irregularis DAH-3]
MFDSSRPHSQDLDETDLGVRKVNAVKLPDAPVGEGIRGSFGEAYSGYETIVDPGRGILIADAYRCSFSSSVCSSASASASDTTSATYTDGCGDASELEELSRGILSVAALPVPKHAPLATSVLTLLSRFYAQITADVNTQSSDAR